MEKKSYAFGFLSAVALIAAIGLWLNSAPVAAEAATTEEAINWCQSQNPWPGTPDSEKRLIRSTWATMTASLIDHGSGIYAEQARRQACEILYDIHHPTGNDRL